MNNLKENIKLRFDKSHRTYDQYCLVQNKITEKSLTILISYIKNLNWFDSTYFPCIADYACGTGESTKKLIQSFHYNECYCIDFSEKLIAIAKNKLRTNNIKYLVSDFDYPLFKNSCLDLIFCNMGLQWSLNFSNILTLFNKYLVNNGIVIFSVPNNNNFPEIKDQFKLKLLKTGDIIKALENTGFELIQQRQEQIIEFFQNPLEALQSLKYTGTNYNKLNPVKADIQCQNIQYRKNSAWNKANINEIFIDPSVSKLTYEIGIYLAIKR